MDKKTGGPAFPIASPEMALSGQTLKETQGMTLRDYFAARALSGLIGRRWEDANGKVPEDIFGLWAKAAYATADAMLEQREK